MKKAKDFTGKETLEVWDFRLSIGSPILYANEDTWVVRIWANDPGDETRKLLEEYATEIPTNGDVHDPEGISACYEWLYSVREKYSRDHVEERKPVCRMINAANKLATDINTQADAAMAGGDINLYHQKKGELQAHLSQANAAIKQAAKDMHARIAEIQTGGVA